MTERRLRELLREHRDARRAGGRGACLARRAGRLRRGTRARVPGADTASAATVAIAAALVLGLALTGPGAAVADWVRDAIDSGDGSSRPLTSLPAPGRLLVQSGQGPWIVTEEGSKRRLGPYAEATWSPRGLFVAATRPRELFALDPKGGVRWSLARRAGVHQARWSPDGFHIAYLSGESLRVVAGDGTGDVRIGPAGKTAPAGGPEQASGARLRRAGRSDPRHGRGFRQACVPSLRRSGTDTARVVCRRTRAARALTARDARPPRVFCARLVHAAAGGRGPRRSVRRAPAGRSRSSPATPPGPGASSPFCACARPGHRAPAPVRGRAASDGLAWSPNGNWLRRSPGPPRTSGSSSAPAGAGPPGQGRDRVGDGRPVRPGRYRRTRRPGSRWLVLHPIAGYRGTSRPPALVSPAQAAHDTGGTDDAAVEGLDPGCCDRAASRAPATAAADGLPIDGDRRGLDRERPRRRASCAT